MKCPGACNLRCYCGHVTRGESYVVHSIRLIVEGGMGGYYYACAHHGRDTKKYA